MHRLLISVAVLFVLLTEGYSLRCFVCQDMRGSCENEQAQCPSDSTHCLSLKAALYIGYIKLDMKFKSCAMPEACDNSSINFDIGKTTISTQCCDTDFCNVRDAPDFRSSNHNGMTCFTCEKTSCLKKLECSGNEDHCITAKVNQGGQPVTMKGCASKLVCNHSAAVIEFPLINNITCCKGNLCNGAKSVTQSFLLLLCPLLTFFLCPWLYY